MRPIICFIWLISACFALYRDELVDWHHKQLGVVAKSELVGQNLIALSEIGEISSLSSKGDINWKFVVNGAHHFTKYEDSSIAVAINEQTGAVIKQFDGENGFEISELLKFDDQLIDFKYKSGIFAILFDDKLVVSANGESFTKKISFNSFSIQILKNGNVLFIYEDGKTKYEFFNGEFKSFDLGFSCKVEDLLSIHENKLVKGNKLFTIDENSGEFKSSTIKSNDKQTHLNHNELIAVERDHHLEIIDKAGKELFKIINVFKYDIKFVKNHFIIFTEFHITIYDIEGTEINSLMVEKLPHEDIVDIKVDYADDKVFSTIEFKNHTINCYVNGEVHSFDNSFAYVKAFAVYETEPETGLNEQEILLEEESSLIEAYLIRLKHHLSELRRGYNALWDLLPHIKQIEFFNAHLNDKLFGFDKKLILGTDNSVQSISTLNGARNWSIGVGADVVKIVVEGDRLLVFLVDGELLEMNATDGEIVSKKVIAPSTSVTQLSPTDFYLNFKGHGLVYSTGAFQNETYSIKHDMKSVEGLYFDAAGAIHETWKLSIAKDEVIVGLAVRSPDETTANVGYVLGDKTVLYKYLNPNVIAIAVLNERQTLLVYVLDGVTGQVLSTVHHEKVHVNQPISVVVGEHWVVYSYFSDSPYPEQKISVIDMFEQDDEIVFKNKSFILPYKIDQLGLTRTKFGITTKSVLVSLANGQILHLPKFVLSSRRVENRPLNAVEKQEFMLLPYDPIITIDDSKMISHELQISTGELVSVPTNLESTSLVCAIGRDLYCTRVAPSLQFDKLGETFNKLMLIVSVCVVLVLILVLKPLTRSKQLKAAWIVEH